MDKENVRLAVDAGIISKQQGEALLLFFNSKAIPQTTEEPLRFIRSFGDIFMTLGIVFVSIAIANTSISGYWNFAPILFVLITTEWLVGKRHLALPGMALLMSALYFIYHGLSVKGNEDILLVSGLMITFCLAFYVRYKMPFTLLPMALGMLAILVALLDLDLKYAPYHLIGFGLLTFSIAMWFDSQDVQRQNYLSDSAFWLHLLASPLIVHGAMISLINTSLLDTSRELFILLFFISFFLIALFIDRRAMLISSLAYAIYAITQLADNLFNNKDLMLFTFSFFGIFIVLFGAYWYQLRHLLFAKVEKSLIARYVPHINPLK